MMKKYTDGPVIRTYEVPFYPEEEVQLSNALRMSLSKPEQKILEDLICSHIRKYRAEGEVVYGEPSARYCLSFRINEKASSDNVVKAEFEQDLYDEYTSGENWTEYIHMHAFRITEDIFEQNKHGIHYMSSYFKAALWPFNESAFCAEDYYLKQNKKTDRIVYEDPSVCGISGKWTETIWWDVYNIYVKDMTNIPGYIHLFYAKGVTEFHIDRH